MRLGAARESGGTVKVSQESSEKLQKRWKELHPECQEVNKGQATPVPSPSPGGANW